jgi:ArsR family transcriptional regulator
MYYESMAHSLPIRLKQNELIDIAEQLKVLGDVTRLELLRAIAETEDAEACVCDLTPATGLTQGTVSHHLKLLVDAGLMTRTQRGKWSYYALTKTAENLLVSLGLKFNSSKRKKASC